MKLKIDTSSMFMIFWVLLQRIHESIFLYSNRQISHLVQACNQKFVRAKDPVGNLLLQKLKSCIFNTEAVAQRCSVKKLFLEISQKSQENNCARSLFYQNCRPEACNFIKEETLAQVFLCEFCGISKNTFLYRTPLVAAFVFSIKVWHI